MKSTPAHRGSAFCLYGGIVPRVLNRAKDIARLRRFDLTRCTRLLFMRRQVAANQSADRSAHSRELSVPRRCEETWALIAEQHAYAAALGVACDNVVFAISVYIAHG